ncbi:unnamed protein product [Didymodactylos carnosus]|uniref:Uncharacterized protein n=1 Tax=Didymodactylos carnosus TaxID=1234261 RepID=A0A8S2ETY8_9BILA|nr:unnamed protein product [Didymodactylos carnosus]CAF4062543.1 unnamed protein product [Didymodactylos carnosus]
MLHCEACELEKTELDKMALNTSEGYILPSFYLLSELKADGYVSNNKIKFEFYIRPATYLDSTIMLHRENQQLRTQLQQLNNVNDCGTGSDTTDEHYYEEIGQSGSLTSIQDQLTNLEAVVKHADMPEDMQKFAVDIAIAALKILIRKHLMADTTQFGIVLLVKNTV